MKNLIRYTLIFTLLSFLLALVSFKFVKTEEMKHLYFSKHFHFFRPEELMDFNINTSLNFPEEEEVLIKVSFGKVKLTQKPGKELSLKLKSKVVQTAPAKIENYLYKKDKQIVIDFTELLSPDETATGQFEAHGNSFTFSDAFDLEITLPENLKKIQISTVSADWDVKNVKSDEIDVNSVSGDFEVEKSEFKKMQLKAVSGDYEIKGTSFDNLDGDSISGDFKISPSTNGLGVMFKTVSGDSKGIERLNQNNPASRLNVRTVSGDLVINMQNK